MAVEWDPVKAKSNLAKHGVSFEEAVGALDYNLASIFRDERHADVEDRFIVYSVTSSLRHVVVSYTNRHGNIRIISARLMTRRERIQYEEDEIDPR